MSEYASPPKPESRAQTSIALDRCDPRTRVDRRRGYRTTLSHDSAAAFCVALRAMHGDRFDVFARSLVGMVRDGLSAFLGDPAYGRMCDDLQSDPVFAQAWNAFAVSTPLRPLEIEVDSAAIGTFRYRTVTLEVPGEDGHWIVVQVPHGECAVRLRGLLLRRLRDDG